MSLTLSGNGITSANIVDSAVTSSKIADGTIVNNDINASANIPASKLSGTGKVLQVVQGVKTDTFTSSSNVWTDITGLSATITPTSTTSKILVIIHMTIGGNSTSYDAATSLLRGSTHIGLPTGYGSREATIMPLNQRGQSMYEASTVSNAYLDSPNTTATTTYKMQMRAYSNTTQYVNRTASDSNGGGDSRHISSITLMEIGA